MCTKQSRINIIQRFQNKVLRNIFDAPLYIENNNLHRDHGIEYVASEIQRFVPKQQEWLDHQDNVQEIQLLSNRNLVPRLNRKKPFEIE